MATHDTKSKEFEDLVQAYILFFRQIGERKAAEYCAHQDATIQGLQENNQSFAKAFRELLEKQTPNP